MMDAADFHLVALIVAFGSLYLAATSINLPLRAAVRISKFAGCLAVTTNSTLLRLRRFWEDDRLPIGGGETCKVFSNRLEEL